MSEFDTWLAGARADFYSMGVPPKQVDQAIADMLGEPNLDAVRANLPPLGSYERANEALRRTFGARVTLLSQVINSGTPSRAELSEEVIQEYAEKILSGAEFPPVIVFYDGKHYHLADGFHRLAASRRSGEKFIKAIVKQGTQRDAELYAAGANHEHGVRRSEADNRLAVSILLSDPEWSQWSDEEIALRCGVSPAFVQKLRKGQ